MPTTLIRPPSQQEDKIIRGIYRRGSQWGDHVVSAGCLMMPVLLIGAIIDSKTTLLRGKRGLWWPLLCIVIWLFVFIRLRLWWASLSRETVSDIGRPVEETVYEVVDAIKIEEYEDEGSNYYLKLKDGGVLFLSGQYLYDVEDESKFPSSRFKIVRTTGTSKTLLDIECLGAYIAPSAVLPAFSKDRLKAGEVPGDGEILQVPFETLSKSLV